MHRPPSDKAPRLMSCQPNLAARSTRIRLGRPSRARADSGSRKCWATYWIELATAEKALLAFDPTNRIVPTTRTRITASMTAYSAMSCPACSTQSLRNRFMLHPAFLRTRVMVIRWRRLGAKGQVFEIGAGAHLPIAAILRALRSLVKTHSARP